MAGPASYTVRYLDADGQSLVADKVAVGTVNQNVTEIAPAINGYSVDAAQKSLTLIAGENLIIFQYTAVIVPPVTPTPAPVGPVDPTPTPTITPTATPNSTNNTTPVGPVTTPAPTDDTTTVVDDVVPAGPASAWALLNLILAICCALVMVVLLVGYFAAKKRREEDASMDEEDALKRKGFWRLLSIIPGIGSLIVFFLTENMSNPMVFTDRWTLLMVAIAVVQVVITLCAKKSHEENDDQDTPEPMHA